MNQRDKLIRRIRARPPEAKFEDVHRLLEAFGYRIAGRKGSHVAFHKDGHPPITVSAVKGRKVKRVYLDLICEILGLDEEP